MVDKIIIKDEDLKNIFNGRIIQQDNANRNAEIFTYNNQILKIYTGEKMTYKYNLYVIKEILKKTQYLKTIKELVLPSNLIIYNKDIVGFSMPYINGITLYDIIENNLLPQETIKEVFVNLLALINSFKQLPFNFFIGDLHEKNIIVDNELNIHIIDPDSFIINNHKLTVDKQVIIGKYPNHYYNNKELKNIGIANDYLCLLCMVLNYTFNGLVDNYNPISYIKNYPQFSKLNYLIDRLNKPNNFYLTKNDIDNIINLKDTIVIEDNDRLTKVIQRIRKI